MAEGAEVSPFLARTTLRWLKPFHARSIKLKVIFKPWYLDPQGLPDEGKVSKVVIDAVWLVLAFWSWAPSCILGLSSTGSELARLCRFLGVGSQSHLQNSASHQGFFFKVWRVPEWLSNCLPSIGQWSIFC